MRIINVYDKDEPRAGDIYSGPVRYFDFPVPVEEMSVRNYDQIPWDEDILIILGGGGLMHIPRPEHDGGRFLPMEFFADHGNKVITWGLGHNVHGAEKIEYPGYMDKFLMNGVRDIGYIKRWVPCASCMHAAFSKRYDVKDTVRMFRREDPDNTNPLPFDYPMMQDAQGNSLDEIVRFLGGADVIITNSYHGMYWGMLLGKTVRVYKPISSKFFGLSEFAEFWQGGLKWSGDRTEFLILPVVTFRDTCRWFNNWYYNDVLNLLKKIMDNL